MRPRHLASALLAALSVGACAEPYHPRLDARQVARLASHAARASGEDLRRYGKPTIAFERLGRLHTKDRQWWLVYPFQGAPLAPGDGELDICVRDETGEVTVIAAR